jgi:YggT family protein
MSLLGIPQGHGLIYALVLYVTGALLLALFVRAILSWFRIDERYAAVRFLAYVAFILAFFLLIVLRTLLLQALPPGW